MGVGACLVLKQAVCSHCESHHPAIGKHDCESMTIIFEAMLHLIWLCALISTGAALAAQ